MHITIPDDDEQKTIGGLIFARNRSRRAGAKSEEAALTLVLDLMIKQQSDKVITGHLLEHGTYEEIEEFAETRCSPGFYRFQLLNKLTEMEEARGKRIL